MKKCIECKKEFRGRTDKIYCSKKCKNKVYFRKKEKTNSITSDVNKILHRNYTILKKEMNGIRARKKIPSLILSKQKFNFKYITNYQINKQGKMYHYVYDLAWMSFSDNEILIVREGKR